MIVQPERYIHAFKEAGADMLTVHWEACTHLHRTIYQIKEEGMLAGVALNPHTPVSGLEDVINDIDLVLIMSVNPGFGGQKFIPRALHKITVEDAGGNTVLLRTNSILYCEQEENYTKIYCKDNQAFTRYGSLTKTLSLLGTELFVQINRKTIVLKKSITSYENGMLWVSGDGNPFEVSTAYQHLFSDSATAKKNDEKTDGNPQQKENQKETVIYRLVAENPGVCIWIFSNPQEHRRSCYIK